MPSLYTINYEALDAITVKARVDLGMEGFETQSLSDLDVRIYALANRMVKDTMAMLKQHTFQKMVEDSASAFVGQLGLPQEVGQAEVSKVVEQNSSAEDMVLMLLEGRKEELAGRFISLHSSYTSDEITMLFMRLYDPVFKSIDKKAPEIAMKLQAAIYNSMIDISGILQSLEEMAEVPAMAAASGGSDPHNTKMSNYNG
jgi:hypothetical protein